MTSRLERLKAAYGQTNERNADDRNPNSKYYPFWDMKVGQRTVVRFIADLNTQNPHGFMVEKVTHKLTINGELKTIACPSMYGEECPICTLAQKYYKAEDKINGKKYYKQRQNMAQVLIVEDPLPPDAQGETHVGKVRTITINYQIRNLIKEAFMSEDEPLENDPDDIENGYDFIIKKTEAGGYATYVVGTKFMSKSRSLTAAEILAINEGAVDLATLLPKNPGRDKVAALLNAELTGGSTDDQFAPQPAPTPSASRTQAPQPTKQSVPITDDDDADDGMAEMLEIIKRRREAAAS